MLPLLLTYKNLILQISLSLTLSLLLMFLKIPTLFLLNLHTYIHPDNVSNTANSRNGVRAAIRRPSNSDSGVEGFQSLSSRTSNELKKRHKLKEKFEFDESNAQIFRLKLDEAHLQSRIYHQDYYGVFNFLFVGFSCFLLNKFLGVSERFGVLTNGDFVPILIGFLGILKVFVSLVKISFEKSASKQSEKQLSALIGVLGFLFGLTITFGFVLSGFDFKFDLIDGFGRFFIAVLMGGIAGFLYMPAGKSARCFWLGTDQIRCNLSIISCGWFAKMLLHANFMLNIFTALLWINPFAQILVNKIIHDSKEVSSKGDTENLVGNVGLSPSDFAKYRLWCLLFSGILQIMVLRTNLQIYLNEAVLSWYQRLHASKIPDLDFSRAKVFLHNHYLCLAVLQFLAPAVLVLLFLGLSQIDGNSFEHFQLVCSLQSCYDVVKEVALFMAWWVVFVWTVFTSASLVMYHWGVLYVS